MPTSLASRLRSTTLAAALLCGAALPCGAPLGARAQSAPAPSAFDLCMLDVIGHPDRQVETHVRALAAFGAAALPRALELAATRELAVPVSAEKTVRLPLSDEVQLALIAAAARAPHADVVRFFDGVALRATTPGEAAVALRILALAGEAGDFPLLRRLASPHATASGATPEVREGFGVALASIVAREPRALMSLWTLYREVEPALADALIRAVGTQQNIESVTTLSMLLGARREFDGRVLAELGRVARELPLSGPAGARETARGYLRDTDPALQRAACQAAVALQDVDAIPDLIELLGAEPELARTALESLRRLSRKALGRDAAEWSRWHLRELQAWSRAEAGVGDLGSSDRAAVAAELFALGRGRLFRHEAARYVAGALDRREPELVRLACDILGELASPVADPALLALKEHEDESVRAAAEDALARVRDSASDRSTK